MTILNIDQWDIESVRATFFGSPRTLGRDERYWRTLVDIEPENVLERPAEGLFTEEGPFGIGRRLVINGAAGRVDLILVPQPTHEWPTVGKFGDSVQSLLSLIDAHRELFTSAHRIALGVVANLRVIDREASYATLGRLLHEVRITSDMRDLMFQINYPRKLASYSTSANRLCRWMAGTMNNIHSKQKFELGHMVRVEIDLNTPPEEQLQMTDVHLRAMFDEFINLAQELLQQGSIR